MKILSVVLNYLKFGLNKSEAYQRIAQLTDADKTELKNEIQEYIDFELQGPYKEFELFPMSNSQFLMNLISSLPVFILAGTLTLLCTSQKIFSVSVAAFAGYVFFSKKNSSRIQFNDMFTRIREITNQLTDETSLTEKNNGDVSIHAHSNE